MTADLLGDDVSRVADVSLFPDLDSRSAPSPPEPLPAVYERSADLSGQYRYHLTRRWATGPLLPIVMLNPSIADADVDDPTIRRCLRFAYRDGFAGIAVVNLFAYRATDPYALREAPDPIGPRNDDVLRAEFEHAAFVDVPILLAWGASGTVQRVADVIELVPLKARVCCLGMTKAKQPRHPLFVRGDQPLVPWEPS